MNTTKAAQKIVAPLRCDSSRGMWLTLLDNLAGFAGVILLANFAYLLRDGDQTVVQFWPASGFAIGFLLLRGACVVPGMAAAAFLAPLLHGEAPLVCLGFMFAGVAEWMIYAFLFWRFLRRASLTRLLTLPLILIGVAAFSSMVAALIGSSSLIFGGQISGVKFTDIAIDWWHGDFIGTIIVLPIMVAHQWKLPGKSDVTKLIGVLGVLLLYIYLLCIIPSSIGVIVLYLVPLLLVARWFPKCGAYWLNAVTCAVMVFLTAKGIGPFVYEDGSYKYVWLGFYFIAIGVTALHIVHFPLGKNKLTYVPLTALVCGVLFSAGVYAYLSNNNRNMDQMRLEELTSDAKTAIRNRLDIYINALRSGSGIYQVDPDLIHTDWVRFAKSLDMPTRYPGINGIGVIDPVRSSNLDEYLQDVRSEGLTEFNIKKVPNVTAPEPDELGFDHFIIRYIEPLDTNVQALGLDIASETNRQKAAMLARDTGEPQITGRITLVQDGKKRPGFLLLLPSYRPGMPLKTVGERRAAFERWIYAPFVTELLFEGVLDSKEGLIDFTVFDDHEVSAATFAYSSFAGGYKEGVKFALESNLRMGGRDFTLGWREGEVLSRTSNAAPMLAGVGFGVVSVLLTGLLASLINANQATGKLVQERTKELLSLNERLEEENADRKMAESEALSANQAKSEFLAVMSHEIRTPLNSVIGFSDIMRRSRLNADQREWSDAIFDSANQLLSLIDDILDFSKMEANKLEIDSTPSNPLEITREVIRVISPLAHQRKNYLKLNVGGHIPERCLLDPTRLRQILTNLIGNANKFTDGGEIAVSLDYDAKKRLLVFMVEDSGVGIPKEKQAKLFQPFTQADGTTTRKFGGTGLGLVICKKLVELMGGKIKLSSEEGAGTRVMFTLAIDVDDQDGEEADVAEDSKPSFVLESNQKRVLLVEDVALNQKLARIFLESLGYDVDIVDSGERSLVMVQENEYDYIFMDYQMPGMNGIEAIARIHELQAARRNGVDEKHPKIISMTANVTAEFRAECEEAGMHAFLAKPFTLEDVTRAIEYADANYK